MPRATAATQFRARSAFLFCVNVLGGVAVLLTASTAAAQAQKRVAIEQIKAGIVGVGTFQRTRTPQFRFLGTGFAVDDGRSIATNAHVIAQLLDSGSDPEVLAVLLPSAELHQSTIVEVTRSAVDDEHDLALLKLKTGRLPALALCADDGVKDGDEFLFTGFPIGAVLGPFAATHRAMVASITPIVIPPPTSDRLEPSVVRRLQRGSFPVYQLDGTAYPGSSGSPLYDGGTGEVVGVVNMVFVKGLKENALAQPSGISYAIPVRHLRELVTKVR
jgi:S1-C subfamily serine protease